MKLSDFILLSEGQKKYMVLSEGIPIATRESDQLAVFLFALSTYYVELHCKPSSKEVTSFRVFPNPEHLTPYLDAIPIDHLLW